MGKNLDLEYLEIFHRKQSTRLTGGQARQTYRRTSLERKSARYFLFDNNNDHGIMTTVIMILYLKYI